MAINEELTLTLRAVNNTAAAFGSMQKSLNDLKTTALKVGTVLVGALAIKDLARSTAEWAEEVEKVKARTGLTTEAASRLAHAARVVGVDADQLGVALTRLDKNMFAVHHSGTLAGEMLKGHTGLTAEAQRTTHSFQLGAAAVVDVFEKWGVRLHDVNGQIRDVNDIFADAAARVRELGDGAAATALEVDLFGRSGANLHRLLMLGAEGLHYFGEEADRLGVTLTPQMAASIRQASRDWRTFDQAMLGLKITLATSVIPFFTFIIVNLTRFISGFRTAITESRLFASILKIASDVLRAAWGFLKSVADALIHLAARLDEPLPGRLITLKDLLVGIAAIAVADKITSLALALTRLGLALLPIAALAAALALVYHYGVIIADTVGNYELVRDAVIGVGIALTLLGITGSAAWTLVLGPIALVATAIMEIVRTVQLVTDNWDKFVSALRSGLLDDIPVFGLFFRAIHEAIDLFEQLVGIANWLSGTFSRIFGSLGAMIADALLGPVNWAIDRINELIDNINTVLGQFGLNIGHIERLSGGAGETGNSRTGALGVGTTGPPIGAAGPLAGLGEAYTDLRGNTVRPLGPGEAPGTAYTYIGTPGILQASGLYSNVFYPTPSVARAGRGENEGLQAGGIVTRPTRALIGEGGPEAVIPLSRSGLGMTIVVNCSGNVTESEQLLADKIGDTIVRRLAAFRAVSY